MGGNPVLVRSVNHQIVNIGQAGVRDFIDLLRRLCTRAGKNVEEQGSDVDQAYTSALGQQRHLAIVSLDRRLLRVYRTLGKKLLGCPSHLFILGCRPEVFMMESAAVPS